MSVIDCAQMIDPGIRDLNIPDSADQFTQEWIIQHARVYPAQRHFALVDVLDPFLGRRETPKNNDRPFIATSPHDPVYTYNLKN